MILRIERPSVRLVPPELFHDSVDNMKKNELWALANGQRRPFESGELCMTGLMPICQSVLALLLMICTVLVDPALAFTFALEVDGNAKESCRDVDGQDHPTQAATLPTKLFSSRTFTCCDSTVVVISETIYTRQIDTGAVVIKLWTFVGIHHIRITDNSVHLHPWLIKFGASETLDRCRLQLSVALTLAANQRQHQDCAFQGRLCEKYGKILGGPDHMRRYFLVSRYINLVELRHPGN